MSETGFVLLNYLLFGLLAETLAGFQSSLWLHIFGYFPSPYVWIAVLNYWVLYRSIYESLIMSYIVALVMATMTGAPLESVVCINLIVWGVLYLLRNRILWSGPNSYMLAAGISALVIPIASFLLSYFVDRHPSTEFYFYDWILRALLTSAFALPLFYLFGFVDRLTRREPPKDTESEVV